MVCLRWYHKYYYVTLSSVFLVLCLNVYLVLFFAEDRPPSSIRVSFSMTVKLGVCKMILIGSSVVPRKNRPRGQRNKTTCPRWLIYARFFVSEAETGHQRDAPGHQWHYEVVRPTGRPLRSAVADRRVDRSRGTRFIGAQFEDENRRPPRWFVRQRHKGGYRENIIDFLRPIRSMFAGTVVGTYARHLTSPHYWCTRRKPRELVAI